MSGSFNTYLVDIRKPDEFEIMNESPEDNSLYEDYNKKPFLVFNENYIYSTRAETNSIHITDRAQWLTVREVVQGDLQSKEFSNTLDVATSLSGKEIYWLSEVRQLESEG